MRSTNWTASTKFNWADVNTSAPPPPDPGLYRARIASASPGESRPDSEGNTKRLIKLEVDLTENEAGDKLKRKVFDTMTLTENALFRVAIICEALGIEPPLDDSGEALDDFCHSIVAAAKSGVWLRLKHDTYVDREGKERTVAKVERYLSDDKVSSSSESEEKAPPRRRK